MFIKTNIFNIIGLLIFILICFADFTFHIPFVLIIFLSLLSIYAYAVFFEYQRITLMIGRYIKSKGLRYEKFNVNQVQMFLASPIIGFGIALETLLTGFVAGILSIDNFLFVIVFLLIKYFLIALISLPIPYDFLFNEVSKALSISGKKVMLSPDGLMLFLEIHGIYKKMPHDSHYEDWIYQNMPKT